MAEKGLLKEAMLEACLNFSSQQKWSRVCSRTSTELPITERRWCPRPETG